MVLDTSALIAILLSEQEAERMLAVIADDPDCWVPAPNLVEATLVMLSRNGPRGRGEVDALVERLGAKVAPLSEAAADAARTACARFGKGVARPGVLNYGDCLAYGVAVALGQPLLFKGDDFARTDVRAVPY